MSTIKIRIKQIENASLIRILIAHPMETGRRRDQNTGKIVPAHYIEKVDVRHNGRIVADCRFGTSVSRDPYLSLRLREAKPGDRIRVAWKDNLGESDSAEELVPL